MNKEKLQNIYHRWNSANKMLQSLEGMDKLINNGDKYDVIKSISLTESALNLNGYFFNFSLHKDIINEIGQMIVEKIKEYHNELELEFKNLEFSEDSLEILGYSDDGQPKFQDLDLSGI